MPTGTRLLLAAAVLAIVAHGPSCKPRSSSDPCQDVACGQGTCQYDLHQNPFCACKPGFVEKGLTCIPDVCPVTACSGHGTCELASDLPSCVCDPPYRPSGLECLATSCDGVDCSGHGKCTVTGGKAACACDAGFEADALECADVGSFTAGLTKAVLAGCPGSKSECSLGPACVLSATQYAEGEFPGQLDLYFDTVADVDVTVSIFFVHRPTPSASGSFEFGFCEEEEGFRHSGQHPIGMNATDLGKPGAGRLRVEKVIGIIGKGTLFWTSSSTLSAKYLVKIQQGP